MKLALVMLLVVVPTLARADSALVLVDELPADATSRLRERIGQRDHLIADADTRAALEGFASLPSPEAQLRSALERVHQRMRNLDLDAVRRELDDGERYAELVPPTGEGRTLAAELAVREAAYALLGHDVAAQVRAMSLALSINPQLALDPAREAPPLVELLERTRGKLHALPRVTLRIDTTPPDATLYVAGAVASHTLELPTGPQVLWASRDGFASRATRIDAKAGASIHVELSPMPLGRRVRPLVDAIRQTTGDPRRAAAVALASALDVRGVYVAGATGDPIYYTSGAAVGEPVVDAPPVIAPVVVATVPRPRPWYKKGWVWGVAGASVAVVAVGITLGIVLGRGDHVEATCCR